MHEEQSPPDDPERQRRHLPTNPEQLRYALDNLREFLQWIERHVGYLVSSIRDVLDERAARKPIGPQSRTVPDWPVLHDRAFWNLLTEDERRLWGQCGERWQHAIKLKRGIRQKPQLGKAVDDMILQTVGPDDTQWELRPYFAGRALDSARYNQLLNPMALLMESLQGLEQEMVDALATGGERYTRPMTIQELLPYIAYGRNAMPDILAKMGAEKVSGKWRVPLRKMPPEYLMKLERTAAKLAEKDAD